MKALKKLFYIESGWIRFFINLGLSLVICALGIVFYFNKNTPAVLQSTFLFIGISAIIELLLYTMHNDEIKTNGFFILLMNIGCLVLRVAGLILRMATVMDLYWFCKYKAAMGIKEIALYAVVVMYIFNFIIREFVHTSIERGYHGYEMILSYIVSYVIGFVACLTGLLDKTIIVTVVCLAFIAGMVVIIKNMGIREYLFPADKAGPYTSRYSGYDIPSSVEETLESGSFVFDGVPGTYKVTRYKSSGDIYVHADYSSGDLRKGQALTFQNNLKGYLRKNLRKKYKIHDYTFSD